MDQIKIPKDIKERCCHLDGGGKRCKKRALYSFKYHGDSELYNTFNGRPNWVVVHFCEEHSKEMK